jgi:hypothetical protein
MAVITVKFGENEVRCIVEWTDHYLAVQAGASGGVYCAGREC